MKSQLSSQVPSINTTYMVQENSALLFNNMDQTLNQLDKNIGDFSPIIKDINFILEEKNKIRAQTAILEELNSENNDLVLKISEAIQARDDYLFQLQITDVQVQEQRFMLSQLLNAAKLATNPQSAQEAQNQQYQSLNYKQFTSQKMTKRTAIGLLGKLDKDQQEAQACQSCCGVIQDVPEALKPTHKPQMAQTDPGTDTVAQRCLSYTSRIQSIILEKQGLEALLSRRIGELHASLARVKDTLGFRDYQSSRQLEEIESQLHHAQQQKIRSEVRSTQLTSDLALMANKGIEYGDKVKHETDNVLRNARREMKIFQLNKQREIDKALKEANEAGIHEMAQLKKEKCRIQVELQQLKNGVKKYNERISVLESELEGEGKENGYLRGVLEEITQQ